MVFEDEPRRNATDGNRMSDFSKRVCARELFRSVKHNAFERGRVLLEVVGPLLPSEPHAVDVLVLPSRPDVGFGQQLKERSDTFGITFVQQDRAKCNAESERSNCGLYDFVKLQVDDSWQALVQYRHFDAHWLAVEGFLTVHLA